MIEVGVHGSGMWALCRIPGQPSLAAELSTEDLAEAHCIAGELVKVYGDGAIKGPG